MTLEHLLTMSSGLDCDDRDFDSPGNEDRVQSQEENPDWYDYTLSLDMLREPGESSVYCSINSNLIGAVLSSATGQRLEDLFYRLIAEPLEINRYHLYLQPSGEPYMGGGIHWIGGFDSHALLLVGNEAEGALEGPSEDRELYCA